MIYVECRPDFTLVRGLTGLPRRELIHELKGKYEIMKRLMGSQNAKAMVDEDPQSLQPRYLEGLAVVRDAPERGLRVLHDSRRNNYVVVLRPRLEEWLVEALRASRIDLSAGYGLPNDPGELHRVINHDPLKLERLIEDQRHSDRFRSLQAFLRL